MVARELTSLRRNAVMESFSSRSTLLRSTSAISVKITSSISNGLTVLSGISAI